ncbi:MAG TPA: phage tail protein [Tepidisphaeraceae bacterium]|nr:phage tail protein [Tepidisphaeraceae bacterium]
MELTLQFDPDPSKVFPRDPRTAFRVAMSAGNRTMATARTRITRVLVKEINLPSRDVRAEIRLKRISLSDARTVGSTVEARIDVKHRPIPVMKFRGTRETKDGVSVLVSRTKGRELLKDAFIAIMKSGHRGVFERKRLIALSELSLQEQIHYRAGALHYTKSNLVRPDGTVDERKRVPRLPIQERFGKTLAGYLANAPDVLDREVAALQGDLTKNVLSQISRFVQRKGTDKFDDLLALNLPENA